MQARLLLMYMYIFYTKLQGYKLCVSSFTVHFTKSCRIKNIMQSTEPICERERERVREGERVCVLEKRKWGDCRVCAAGGLLSQLLLNIFFFHSFGVFSWSCCFIKKAFALQFFFSFFNTHLNGSFCYLIRTHYWIDSFGKFLILLLLKNRFWSCFWSGTFAYGVFFFCVSQSCSLSWWSDLVFISVLLVSTLIWWFIWKLYMQFLVESIVHAR